jgi:hypothetical protein
MSRSSITLCTSSHLPGEAKKLTINLTMANLRAELLASNFTNTAEEYYPLNREVQAVFNFKIKTIFLDLTFHAFLKLNYILQTTREREREREREIKERAKESAATFLIEKSQDVTFETKKLEESSISSWFSYNYDYT